MRLRPDLTTQRMEMCSATIKLVRDEHIERSDPSAVRFEAC